jgi:hypothetical protein
MDLNTDNKRNKSNEIDVIGIASKVLKEKKTLGVFVSVFAIIGIIVALNTQKEYTSTVVLAPEITNSSNLPESLGDIASMVGVDFSSKGSSMDAIYPEIYPEVFASSDFIVNLFGVHVKQENDLTSKTYYNHLIKDRHIPFWSYPGIWIGKLFQKKGTAQTKALDPFRLTKEQNGVCGLIRSSISCTIDKKTNVITISVKDFDRQVAAIMADTIQSRLQQYITMYRTKKARNDLAYAEKLYHEAKSQYIKSQELYASYSDANEDLILQSFKSKQDELENEMQLRYNIYNQSVQQLQMAKAKIQESTPAFTTIQGASVPIKASSRPRSMIVVLYILLGIVFDAFWILFLRNLVMEKMIKK